VNASILIADESDELTSELRLHLEQDGFRVNCVHDGETAINKVLAQPVDAIILDILLPKINGFEVLKTLRKHSNIPALILTARVDDVDRIVAFETGADDYLIKPCNPHELIARLRALLRRAQKSAKDKSIIQYHNIKVDCARRLVSIADKALELTNTEFNILEKLIKSPGQAFSKEELTEHGIGRKFTAYDRSIDVHISNLRNKLGENPDGGTWIKTLRGFGYMFDAPKTDPLSSKLGTGFQTT
jgi:two-component system response regulator CpxR